MIVLMSVAALLAGLIHVLIFCMESLWWTTPQVRARFRQTPEQAATTRLLAFNQGFYNLFLGLGTLGGLALSPLGHPHAGFIIVGWNCLFMVGAAVILALSAPGMWRGALIQGTAPLLYLALAVVRLAG